MARKVQPLISFWENAPMNGDDEPERLLLNFAVLDGSNPSNWSIFGKPFPEIMQQAANVTPYAVGQSVLQRYVVRVEAIWSPPKQLLKEKQLDDVAGVIIDAWPKDTLASDLEEKRETLRDHLLKTKKKCGQNGQAAFKRFGYSVWFVTDHPSTVMPYRPSFNDVASIMESTNFQYITQERVLMEHLAAYLSNIYNALERGK
jgi:hypothetical protein